MRAFIALVIAATLSGCLEVGSPTPSAPTVTYKSRCPPLKQYTRAEQNRLADELQALPAGSTVEAVVGDFYKMRKACRAVEAVNR